MYPLGRRGNQECLALCIIALMALFRPQYFCCLQTYTHASARTLNFCVKRVCTRTHTRVNCATLIVEFSKCSHSAGGVINNPERMDKSEATI